MTDDRIVLTNDDVYHHNVKREDFSCHEVEPRSGLTEQPRPSGLGYGL